MKFISSLIIFISFTSLVKSQSNFTDADEEDKAWKNWIDENARVGRRAVDVLTIPLNRDAFVENYRAVKRHNYRYQLGLETYEKTLDTTATLTQEQFVLENFGLIPDNVTTDLNITEEEFHLVGGDTLYNNLPLIWDIRKHGPGKLLPAKKQGGCGACWAFSTLAAISNAYSVATGLSYSLSEQEQIDCNTKANGCSGGWFTQAFQYAKDSGLRLDSFYPPYTGKKGECMAAFFLPILKVSGYTRLPADDPNAVKFFITKNGACAVGVAASGWQMYKSGIYHTEELTPKLNHGVIIIGYGPGYWLLQNSWGPNWGEEGTIKVADNGKGGIFMNHIYCPTISLF